MSKDILTMTRMLDILHKNLFHEVTGEYCCAEDEESGLWKAIYLIRAELEAAEREEDEYFAKMDEGRTAENWNQVDKAIEKDRIEKQFGKPEDFDA